MQGNKHVILIGFKGVGKTTIGKRLAKEIGWLFFDLDKEMERVYFQKHGKKLSFRKIMQLRGEKFFRGLETKTLKQVIKKQQAVIALGGGTVFASENRKIIRPHTIVNINTFSKIILKRLTKNGRPSFIGKAVGWQKIFIKQHKKFNKNYKGLGQIKVRNNSSVKTAVSRIVGLLA
jgi:shikimate kinase